MTSKTKLIYPELSYKIVGAFFDVHNALGGGLQEKYYQRALEEAFKKNNLNYQSQFLVQLTYNGKNIGRYFADFLVDDKIIVELKVGDKFYPKDINQVSAYLKATNKKLGILVNFGKKLVKYTRIVNEK